MIGSRKVIKRFLEGIRVKGKNLNSNGTCLFTYNTCLAQWQDKSIIVNISKYTFCSTRHLAMLLQEIPEDIEIKLVKNIPECTKILLQETE